MTGKAEIPADLNAGPHTHPDEEVGYVLEGTVTIELDGTKKTLKAGEAFAIPAGKGAQRQAGPSDRLSLEIRNCPDVRGYPDSAVPGHETARHPRNPSSRHRRRLPRSPSGSIAWRKFDRNRIDLHVPGAGLAIVRGDDVIFARGFGIADIE